MNTRIFNIHCKRCQRSIPIEVGKEGGRPDLNDAFLAMAWELSQ